MANRAGKQKRKRYLKLKRKLESRQVNSLGTAGPAVIGFTARREQKMVCDEQLSCVVCGSRGTMKMFLKKHGLPAKDHLIECTTADQVLGGMSLGGNYALDREAYEKFLPSATAAGLNLSAIKFAENPPEGIWFAKLTMNLEP